MTMRHVSLCSVVRPLRSICQTRRLLSSVPTIIAAGSGSLSPTMPAARRVPHLTHYFDTHHIVTRLETAGFEHGQAVATMNAIRALLVNDTEIAKAEMLSRADLENVIRG